jgi:hypothetical protein
MNAQRARKIRQAVRAVVRDDLNSAWTAIQHCPWRARVRLGWRLAIGRNMDGTRKAVAK